MTIAGTKQKRAELNRFLARVLLPNPAIQAVIAYGSIAMGTARPDSDIDAVVFFAPYDPYIVPAEFIWLEADGTYHSIFSRTPGVQEKGIQFDLSRYDLAEWASADFDWPEAVCCNLASGWIAFDRHGQVAKLIAERTAYPDARRMARLDRAIVELDLALKWDEPNALWEQLGAVTAMDRLQATYDAMIVALFAYNRAWRPYRGREMTHLLKLNWLPDNFASHILLALNAPTVDYSGYVTRHRTLQTFFEQLLFQLQQESAYGEDPVSTAFIRTHDEPGRAWNMDEWNELHRMRTR